MNKMSSHKFNKISAYASATHTFIAVLACVCAPCVANAQALSAKYLGYIDKYKDVALRHRAEYGIPASITLAQGLLESNCGDSRLARVGNNHFGIKCGKWTGDTILKDDDRKDDCFRRYRSAEESYRDHALFLKRDRYAPLFKLHADDYKGWARTLSKCGYATDPGYPDKLIGIIERYGLYNLDNGRAYAFTPDNESDDYEQTGPATTGDDASLLGGEHIIMRRWGMHYVVARAGDTYRTLAAELGIKDKKLAKWNDADKDDAPAPGETVWLEQKQKKAAQGIELCPVRPGDNLRSISQTYGIRRDNLRKLNHLDKNEEPPVGTKLRMR